jgi:hypothetical protein
MTDSSAARLWVVLIEAIFVGGDVASDPFEGVLTFLGERDNGLGEEHAEPPLCWGVFGHLASPRHQVDVFETERLNCHRREAYRFTSIGGRMLVQQPGPVGPTSTSGPGDPVLASRLPRVPTCSVVSITRVEAEAFVDPMEAASRPFVTTG